MKVVYRIQFPCGHFYIGCTKQTIKNRMKGHLNNKYGSKLLTFIKDNRFCLSEIIDFTSVIYEGSIAFYKEQLIIYNSRNNPRILNTRLLKNEPQLRNYINIEMWNEAFKAGADSIKELTK